MVRRHTPRATIRTAVEANQTATFVVLTFAVSWAYWVPILAGFVPESITELPGVFVPGVFGPLIGAVGTVWLSGGSVRAWLSSTLDLRRLGATRTGSMKRWTLLAVFVPVALGGLVVAGLFVESGSLEFGPLVLFPLLLVYATVLGGGQEEPGWRGFALPRLQERYTALTASLVIGVVWAVWHLPMFVLPAGPYADLSFALYLPMVLAFSVVLTWLYNGSGGIVPLAMVFHGGVNTAPNLAGAAVGVETAVTVAVFQQSLTVASVLAAVVVLVVYGPATLADGDAVTTETRGDVSQTEPASSSGVADA